MKRSTTTHLRGKPWFYRTAHRNCTPLDGGSLIQSGSKENHACFTSKENLRHAFIEGRCTRTHKVCVFHEINGQQFENFQWLGRVVRQNLPGVETQKLAPSIIGARIVGRDFIYSVDILGNTSRNVRSEEDKKVIFHGTGK